ncbi:MAG: hypothetical protein SFY92_09185 [Verrucomicrobiae bacterium]|nr:hypothetical protein [Verrucomicrobiae bacterium]
MNFIFSDFTTTQSKIGNPHSAMVYLGDGLALLHKGNERYAVEPHASGGTPFSAENSDKSRAGRQPGTDNHASGVLITDYLGSTIVTFTAMANFYRDSVVGVSIQSGWTSNNPATAAGQLLSTTMQPNWWVNSGFTHSLTMNWE